MGRYYSSDHIVEDHIHMGVITGNIEGKGR